MTMRTGRALPSGGRLYPGAMTDPVHPVHEPQGETLRYEDLARGMLVEWRWPVGGTGDLAAENGVRPLGRVVTREDLPTMSEQDGPLGVQTLDAAWWVLSPATVLAKGGRFWRAAGSTSAR